MQAPRFRGWFRRRKHRAAERPSHAQRRAASLGLPAEVESLERRLCLGWAGACADVDVPLPALVGGDRLAVAEVESMEGRGSGPHPAAGDSSENPLAAVGYETNSSPAAGSNDQSLWLPPGQPRSLPAESASSTLDLKWTFHGLDPFQDEALPIEQPAVASQDVSAALTSSTWIGPRSQNVAPVASVSQTSAENTRQHGASAPKRPAQAAIWRLSIVERFSLPRGRRPMTPVAGPSREARSRKTRPHLFRHQCCT